MWRMLNFTGRVPTAPCTPYHTKLRSSEYQKKLKSSGSFAPRTPSQLRCSIWRCGGRPAAAGQPPLAPSAWPRADARGQILRGAGKSLPRSFRLLQLELSIGLTEVDNNLRSGQGQLCGLIFSGIFTVMSMRWMFASDAWKGKRPMKSIALGTLRAGFHSGTGLLSGCVRWVFPRWPEITTC